MAEHANFKVEFPDSETPAVYPDGTKFRIEDNGVLVIAWKDGKREHIAPGAWRAVIEQRRPSEGRVVIV